jgi:hypothetical protein
VSRPFVKSTQPSAFRTIPRFASCLLSGLGILSGRHRHRPAVSCPFRQSSPGGSVGKMLSQIPQQRNDLAIRQHAVGSEHSSAWLAIRGRQPEQCHVDNVLRVWRVHCRAQPEGQSAERRWSGAIMTGGASGRVDRGAVALYVPAWWSQAIRLTPAWHRRLSSHQVGVERPIILVRLRAKCSYGNTG